MAATVSVVSGVQQTTQALAESNSPATTAGKMRIRDVVILNTSGVYSVVSQRDRRPWARGFRGKREYANESTEVTEKSMKPIVAGGLNMRAEIGDPAGVDITLFLSLKMYAECEVNIAIELNGQQKQLGRMIAKASGVPVIGNFNVTDQIANLVTGTNLIVPLWELVKAGSPVNAGPTGEPGCALYIREDTRAVANNGTS